MHLKSVPFALLAIALFSSQCLAKTVVVAVDVSASMGTYGVWQDDAKTGSSRK